MVQPAKTVIVTDSSCDLSNEQLSRYGIRMLCLRMITKDREYRDRIDIQQDELYALLEKEVPKTSLPEPDEIAQMYEGLIAEGVTDVLHFTLSSGLSGTFNTVRLVAEGFRERLNIRVVDARTLSTGLGMMVLEAAQQLEKGATPDQAVEAAQKVRETQLGMFVIRTLEFLRKGGRIGKVEGAIGSLLKIKPVIFVNDDGVYQTLAKARGFQNAVQTMLDEAKRFFGDAKVKLSVVHGNVPEEAEALLNRIKEVLNVAEDSFISPISPVLAIHTGAGLLGIVANRVE